MSREYELLVGNELELELELKGGEGDKLKCKRSLGEKGEQIFARLSRVFVRL